MLITERLILRKWKDEDAPFLFRWAKDPSVGPAAGWPAHQSEKESLNVIKNVLNGRECYAICEKGKDIPIGSVELKLKDHSDRTDLDDESELGYWLGKPFWGRGYRTEAVEALLKHGFIDLNRNKIWCGYYQGNRRSKRVQEKAGFVPIGSKKVFVSLMNETRIVNINALTKERWEAIRNGK